MKIKTSIIIPTVFLISIIGFSFYAANKQKNALRKYGVKTIGITYDSNPFGNGGTVHYFFKTPAGIYKGAINNMNIKCPRHYYWVLFSSEDPTISKLIGDSIVADSIGVKYIKFEEIDPDNYVNRKDYP